ncbi:MAG: sulfotransferase family protein [Acidimicrobiia bacterium]
MALPTFLIIGAPKAGTTSLYHYVGQHPDVFTSAVKEPGFFWTHRTEAKIDTLEDYQKLFRGSESFRAVGEGSPTYLSDENAPALIKELIPNAKLLAILRDPYKRAFSDFVFLRLRGQEPETAFLEAVEADFARPAERRINYVGQGLYHRNLSRYLSFFDKSQLKIVLLEDLEANPDAVLADVFRFLEVDPSVKVDTSVRLTQSGVPRFRMIHWLLSDRNPVKRWLTPVFPTGVQKALRQVRSANLEKQSMSPAERQALAVHFEADLDQLEQLLDRDLGHWRAG